MNRHLVGDTRRYDAADYGRRVGLQFTTLALDSAQAAGAPHQEQLAGTFLVALRSSTGTVNVGLNGHAAPRLPFQAGDRIETLGGDVITRVFLDWDAQPGKTITLVHGDGLSVDLASEIQTINSILNAVPLEAPLMPTSSYWRNNTSAALGTVFTPAANTNGARVSAITGFNSVGLTRFMMKTSAPASYSDSGAVTIAQAGASGMYSALPMPLRIPAGYGLYEQGSGADPQQVDVTYELL